MSKVYLHLVDDYYWDDYDYYADDEHSHHYYYYRSYVADKLRWAFEAEIDDHKDMKHNHVCDYDYDDMLHDNEHDYDVALLAD